MQREEIVFVGTSDLSGHFRGKSFPVSELPARLARGVGLAPTNMYISAFGPIQVTTFGTEGEVFLMPDPATEVRVPFDGAAAEHFLLADIQTEAGTPWAFCPRQVLRSAVERLEREMGLRLLATFEQEFIYSGVPPHPPQPYELDAYRRQGVFGETLIGALRQAGVVPDSFLSEFGAQQYEITTAPALGVRAADEAVITREITQAVAFHFGHRVSFAPKPTAHGTSNGTHIHFSFLDREDRAVLYAPGRPLELSALGASFVAGMLEHLPALCAVTAPSVASYYRLRPSHWAPVEANVGTYDRGAAVRICAGRGTDREARARHYNLEFRVADATANPYLALALMLQAGLEGVRRRLDLGAHRPRPLPDSLSVALTQLEAAPEAREWLGVELLEGYLKLKRAEIAGLEALDENEICRRYAEVY
ncbi:MAG TPA: glutamine synthetase family protein [Steroidobacteraceae bacterium]|nr:glutamine synthetase family protein [Steroidobacteraceae bacterium]